MFKAMNLPGVIEIISNPAVSSGILGTVIIQYISYLKNREVKIKLKSGNEISTKGLSQSDAIKLIEAAEEITITKN